MNKNPTGQLILRVVRMAAPWLLFLLGGASAHFFSANPEAPLDAACDASQGACGTPHLPLRFPSRPAPGSWVVDAAQLLSPKATIALEANLTSINASTKLGCYLVLLPRMPEEVADKTLKEFARLVPKKWFPVDLEDRKEAVANKRRLDRTGVLVVIAATGRAEFWTGSKAKKKMTSQQARANYNWIT